jgi:hypothetical protein
MACYNPCYNILAATESLCYVIVLQINVSSVHLNARMAAGFHRGLDGNI